jgi:antitoxin CcdA
MRMDDFDPNAPKRATNLSVNGDLLARAREHHFNLSSTLERALVEALKKKKRERWLSDNKDAIGAYNEHVEKHGSFGDYVRSF